MTRFYSLTKSLRLVLLFALVLAGLGSGVQPGLAQGDTTGVESAPELPGVPDDIPVAGFVTLDLEGGEYQWQTTTRTTVARDGDPIIAHNGFLLSIDQAIVVIQAGGPSRPLSAGKVMPLEEGERILPVVSGDTLGKIVLVEFVSLDELRGDEQPDQSLPVTLDAGVYTIALLDITNVPDDGPSAGEIIAQAAGPGFSIPSKKESDAASEDVPLVIWLANIFLTGTSAETGDSTPVVDDEPTAEPSPTATTQQDDTESTLEPTAESTESGDVEPTVVPTESATEEPDVTTAPVLPGVPADIPLMSFVVLELPAGDYQWQTRSITSLTRTDDPLDVHDGFLIAVDQPVIVLKAGSPSQAVPAGQALVLEDGDRILPTASGDTPANLVIVEFVAIENIGADEAPDQVLPLTLEAGVYTLAVLDVANVAADGPTPGQIIAEAAGPGFGISAEEETGETSSEAPPLTWLVSIFPATEEDLPSQ